MTETVFRTPAKHLDRLIKRWTEAREFSANQITQESHNRAEVIDVFIDDLRRLQRNLDRHEGGSK